MNLLVSGLNIVYCIGLTVFKIVSLWLDFFCMISGIKCME